MDGSFTTSSSQTTQLVFDGGIVAAFNGSGLIGFGANLDMDNKTTPSELINYRPDYLWLLKADTILGEQKTFYQETNP